MIRGTFANIRLRNPLVPGTEGNITVYLPTGEQMPIFDAASAIRARDSADRDRRQGIRHRLLRDWAAKGTLAARRQGGHRRELRAIHRSNLVGMGVLPLQFLPGENAASLGLTGDRNILVRRHHRAGAEESESPSLPPAKTAQCSTFETIARIDSPIEVEYYRNGGILQTVLRRLAQG